ncbi:hypothetical protein GUITHDRAFT_155961, partial [Guillardia theta CCMP2712]
MSLSPMSGMLADTCRAIGFDYAELWARKVKQAEPSLAGISLGSRTPMSVSPQRSPRLMPLNRAIPDRAKLSSNVNEDDEDVIQPETDSKLDADSKDAASNLSQADIDIKIARHISDDSKRSRFGSYGIDSDGKRSRFGSYGLRNDDGDAGSLWSAFSGKKGKGEADKGGHEKYASKLRYTGDSFLDDSTLHANEQDESKTEALERFLKLADKVNYTKGEGSPGWPGAEAT